MRHFHIYTVLSRLSLWWKLMKENKNPKITSIIRLLYTMYMLSSGHPMKRELKIQEQWFQPSFLTVGFGWFCILFLCRLWFWVFLLTSSIHLFWCHNQRKSTRKWHCQHHIDLNWEKKLNGKGLCNTPQYFIAHIWSTPWNETKPTWSSGDHKCNTWQKCLPHTQDGLLGQARGEALSMTFVLDRVRPRH